MNDSFPYIFKLTQKEADSSCSSDTLNTLFLSIPLQKLNQKEIEQYRKYTENQISCGKAAYLSGYKWPFLPNILQSIFSAEFKKPEYQTIFILNSFISWAIFYERTKISNDYIKLLLSSLIKAGEISYPNLCAKAFLHMYRMLIDSNTYVFDEDFFEILNKFIIKNPKTVNYSLSLLAETKEHIDKSLTPLMLKSIDTVVKNVENLERIDTKVADKVIQANIDSIIDMNFDALNFFEGLSVVATSENFLSVFKEVPLTLIDIIKKEGKPSEWPVMGKDNFLVVEKLKKPKERNFNTTISTTFENGLGELNNSISVTYNDYTDFFSNETIDKLMVFVQTSSKSLLFSTIFINSYFSEALKYKDSPHIPNILATLVFLCRNLQSSLENSLFAPLLFRSYVFDLSTTFFDKPEKFDLMSRLRQEIVMVSLKEGSSSFNELLETFKLYPKMLAEIFYRLCQLRDEFILLVKHAPRVIKTVIDCMQYYQQLDLLATENKEEIENTRRAQLTFLNILFSKKISAEFLYQNQNLVDFLCSFIYENSLRSFVLDKIQYFFTETSQIEVNYAIGPIINIFIQKESVAFLDEDFCSLILDIIDMLTNVHRQRKGLSSIIGPIHESVNIMIHKMPPTRTTEVILFQCINLFIEAGEDNMLTDHSMMVLSDSIINFYKGAPPSDLYHRILQLFIENSSAEQNPEFEIVHKSVFMLLFGVFIRSKLSSQLISFISHLFDFSVKNCIIGHECGIDIRIIDVLNEIKTENVVTEEKKEKVASLLHLFEQIDSKAASEKSIKAFMSLLTTLEDGSVSEFHSQFIRTLYRIVISDYSETKLTMKIGKKIHKSVKQSEEHITLIFWISINEFQDQSADLISLNAFGKSFVISLESDNLTINCDGNSSNIGKLLQAVWSFVYVKISKTNKEIDVDTALEFFKNKRKTIHISEHKDKNIEISTFDSYVDGEISYISVLPTIKDEVLHAVYQKGPFVQQPKNEKDVILFESSNSRNQIAPSSLTSILMHKMKFRPFMKQFATILNDTAISPLFIGILVHSLPTSEEGQKIFKENDYILSLAWIISKAGQNNLTYSFYLSLHSLFMSLSNIDLRKQLFKIILTDPGLWFSAKKEDHENIVAHWARVLYSSFMPESVKLRSFSSLLDLLMMYYWPEVGPENNEANEIDLHYCRSNFHIIFQKVAAVKFTSKDFERLLAQCYSCNNIEFSMYLLLVMNSLLMEFPDAVRKAGITSEKIAIFQFLLNKRDDNLTTDVLETIIHFHRLNIIDEQLLSMHIDALTISLRRENFEYPFFRRIIILMSTDAQELLSLCCWFASGSEDSYANELALKLSTFKYTITNYPIWCFWPLIMTITKPATKYSVFEFLFREAGNNWMSIIPNIFIASEATKTSADLLVASFVSFILDKDSVNINTKINLIMWMLTTRESYTINKELENFFPEFRVIKQEETIKQKDISLTNLAKAVVLKPSFKFGLRLDEEGNWLDLELACNCVSKVMKYVNESCIDQFVWLVLMIKKTGGEEKLNPLFEYIKTSTKDQGFAFLLSNFNGIKSIQDYKRIYDAPLRHSGLEMDRIFNETYSATSLYMKNFFEVLLPKFTKNVMGMVDAFNDSVRHQSLLDKKLQDKCHEAFLSLVEN